MHRGRILGHQLPMPGLKLCWQAGRHTTGFPDSANGPRKSPARWTRWCPAIAKPPLRLSRWDVCAPGGVSIQRRQPAVLVPAAASARACQRVGLASVRLPNSAAECTRGSFGVRPKSFGPTYMHPDGRAAAKAGYVGVVFRACCTEGHGSPPDCWCVQKS